MKQLIELIHEYQHLSRKRKRSAQPLSEEEQTRLVELRQYLDKHLRNDASAQRHRQSRPRLHPVSLEETHRDMDALSFSLENAPHSETAAQQSRPPQPSRNNESFFSQISVPQVPPSAPNEPNMYIPSGPSFPAASIEVFDIKNLSNHTEKPSNASARALRNSTEQAPPSLDQLPELSPKPKASRKTAPPPTSSAPSQDRWHFLPRPATQASADALPVRSQEPASGIVELDLTNIALELSLPQEDNVPIPSPYGKPAAPPAMPLSVPLLIELRRMEHKRRRVPLAPHEETRFRELLDQLFLCIE